MRYLYFNEINNIPIYQGIPGTYHYIDVIFYYFFFFINPCNSATADIDIHTHRIDREKEKKRKNI